MVSAIDLIVYFGLFMSTSYIGLPYDELTQKDVFVPYS